MTSALDFKARVDSLTSVLCCLCATESSDSPLVQYLLTSWHLNFRFSVPKIENLTSTIWKGINFGFFSEFVNALVQKVREK